MKVRRSGLAVIGEAAGRANLGLVVNILLPLSRR